MEYRSSYAIICVGIAYICGAIVIAVLVELGIETQFLPQFIMAISLASFLFSFSELIRQLLIDRQINIGIKQINIKEYKNIKEYENEYKEVSDVSKHVKTIYFINALNLLAFFELIFFMIVEFDLPSNIVTLMSIISFGVVLITFGVQDINKNTRALLETRVKLKKISIIAKYD